MKVQLVSVTQPAAVIPEIKTSEDLMVYCARVSNPSNQRNVETGSRLLAYCIAHQHWSVFELAHMTVEITTSRAIAQQILRHRSFSFQEFSQRYAVATDFEPVELREQGKTNRQGGEAVFDPFVQGCPDVIRASAAVLDAVAYAEGVYKSLLDAGVAKECARFVLPLCTQTRLYMAGSVRSWIHYLKIRMDGHAQKEHRDVANAIFAIFAQQFPVTAAAAFPQP